MRIVIALLLCLCAACATHNIGTAPPRAVSDTGSITGHVYDASTNLPIVNQPILLRARNETEAWYPPCATGADGGYEFADLEYGEYIIYCGPEHEYIAVFDGDPVVVDFYL